jgi:hypothetical protein
MTLKVCPKCDFSPDEDAIICMRCGRDLVLSRTCHPARSECPDSFDGPRQVQDHSACYNRDDDGGQHHLSPRRLRKA